MMGILDWLAPLLFIGLGLHVLPRFAAKPPLTAKQQRNAGRQGFTNWLFLIGGTFLLALQFFELLAHAHH